MFFIRCNPSKFPSNMSSFVIHLISSPDCKHLTQQDETNKVNGNFQNTQLRDINNLHLLDATPANQPQNLLIEEARFTKIHNIHETYFKCFSCHGIQRTWQPTDDPWQIQAAHFPYCSHVIKWKTKFFVKEILKRQPYTTMKYTIYYKFLQQQIRTLNLETMQSELDQLLNPGNTITLLENINLITDTLTKFQLPSTRTHTQPQPIKSRNFNNASNVSFAQIKTETHCYYLAHILLHAENVY